MCKQGPQALIQVSGLKADVTPKIQDKPFLELCFKFGILELLLQRKKNNIWPRVANWIFVACFSVLASS